MLWRGSERYLDMRYGEWPKTTQRRYYEFGCPQDGDIGWLVGKLLDTDEPV